MFVNQIVLLHRFMDPILMDARALIIKNAYLKFVITIFVRLLAYYLLLHLCIKMDALVLLIVFANQTSVIRFYVNQHAFRQVLLARMLINASAHLIKNVSLEYAKTMYVYQVVLLIKMEHIQMAVFVKQTTNVNLIIV